MYYVQDVQDVHIQDIQARWPQMISPLLGVTHRVVIYHSAEVNATRFRHYYIIVL